MSEVQSRPHGSRGRGSFRGGRGGYRGARANSKSQPQSEAQDNNRPASQEEEGEVGELKRTYGDKVTSLRAICPDWNDEDLVYALKETNGDADLAFERISTGAISRWGEVKKKQPKPKDANTATAGAETTGGARGGRGRSNFEGRGRGRASERGRTGRGGRTASQTNGTKVADKATTAAGDGAGEPVATVPETTGSWDAAPASSMEGVAATGDWSNDAGKDATPAPTTESRPQAPPTSKVTGWAGLFAKAPLAPKKAPAPVPVPEPEAPHQVSASDEPAGGEGLTAPPIEQPFVEDGPSELPEAPSSETPLNLTPSRDELTEHNLEQLPDISAPVASETAASTVASTQEALGTNTTLPPVRPGMSGYAASALKATSGAGRTASFQRRVMEQQEAVVMPGNHAVDRAAVQFGSMGLNGAGEDLDFDEEREEPETRTQLPDDSPAAPRASLPPSSHTHAPITMPESMDQPQPPRPAPGLPPVANPQQHSASPPSSAGYGEQYRYGQGQQKAYDPFGQQPSQAQPTPSSQEVFASQGPAQAQQASPAAAGEYSNYYSGNSRDAYQNYYGYGQGQDAQQRSGSAFGTSSQEGPSQYATSRPQPTYGQAEAQGSGQNTPNAAIPGHQAQHSQHMQPAQGGHGGYQYGYANSYNQYPQYGQSAYAMTQMGGRYGANRPMFDDVRRQPDADYYSNQYGYGHNQQYGGSYNKQSMYAQPQHQYSYEHSASPANAGGYSQTATSGRDAAYGRTGSAQPSEAAQTASSTAFGGMPDPFGRSHSGFGSHAQPMSQQLSGPQVSGDDPAKAYDTAKATGPSPSIAQAHRPASAINSIPGQQQHLGQQAGSFPPSQSQHTGQQAFGGYPQYGGVGVGVGVGGLGGHHQVQSGHHQAQAQAQAAGYGGYGSNAAFGSYGGGYGASGRGWNGNNYGGH